MNGASHPLRQKREALLFATQRGLSQRRACLLIEMNRSSARYAPQPPDEDALLEKIQAIQNEAPRYGVRRVHDRLRKKGEVVNHKRVQRVMRIHGLLIRRTRKHKTIRTGASVPMKAAYPNHVWTLDFQHDALICGRKMRLLNILDEFTREWLAVVVGTSANAKTVIATLLPLFAKRGAPAFLRSDNGSEFVAHDLKALLGTAGASSYYIDPGKPWQNGYVESFHSRLRDELLDREAFASVLEAGLRLERHRHWYNQERPHSSLGFRSPEEFRQNWEQRQQAQDGQAARPSGDPPSPTTD